MCGWNSGLANEWESQSQAAVYVLTWRLPTELYNPQPKALGLNVFQNLDF